MKNIFIQLFSSVSKNRSIKRAEELCNFASKRFHVSRLGVSGTNINSKKKRKKKGKNNWTIK